MGHEPFNHLPFFIIARYQPDPQGFLINGFLHLCEGRKARCSGQARLYVSTTVQWLIMTRVMLSAWSHRLTMVWLRRCRHAEAFFYFFGGRRRLLGRRQGRLKLGHEYGESVWWEDERSTTHRAGRSRAQTLDSLDFVFEVRPPRFSIPSNTR